MPLAVGAVVMAGAGLVAQSQLAQLGLTETAARTFVLNEIKGPSASRGALIEVAGTRAFLKLPPAARGPAATALFAWAKSYVSSPAFINSYDAYRNGRLPPPRQTGGAGAGCTQVSSDATRSGHRNTRNKTYCKTT